MIGQKLGSFLIEGKLGAGAMGVVYRASHEKTGKPAAVKVVISEAGKDAGPSKRFQREAEILQQFRHPNIVRFLAVGRYQGTNYFAMEFIQGDTLDRALEAQGVLDWRQAVDYAHQLCEALQYAHERGIVHRDLKPSNLMVTEDGRLKLTDFGIAKDLDATALTATGRTLGTAAYMAPEQIRGTPEVSHKTDLYALGCLIYQMVGGEAPFQGRTIAVLMNQHLNEAPPRPSGKNPDIPVALDKLVVELMSKDPKARPWDAQAVGVVLKELLDKAARNEAVPMVFGGVQHPTRIGAAVVDPGPASPRPATPTAPTRIGKTSTRSTRRRVAPEVGGESRRLGPETIGLASALVTGLALTAYLAWPASADSLYRRAAEMMASKDSTRWIMAQDQYFDAIDGKHPDADHPHRRQVRAWRDQIGLEKARRRSEVLDSPNFGRAAKPDPEKRQEGLYVEASTAAAAYSQAGNDAGAADRWEALAATLRIDDAHERPWVLLARSKAAALKSEMDARRQLVTNLLAKAEAAEITHHPEDAKALRDQVARRYGGKADLRDLLARHGALSPDGPPTAPPGSSTSPAP